MYSLNKLKFGSVLPDAAANGNSRFKISGSGETRRTYDLTGFRTGFISKIPEDDLYLDALERAADFARHAERRNALCQNRYCPLA